MKKDGRKDIAEHIARMFLVHGGEVEMSTSGCPIIRLTVAQGSFYITITKARK